MMNRRDRIKALITPWQESGKCLTRFCREENISVFSFRYWLKKWGIKPKQHRGEEYNGFFIPLIIKPGNKLPESSSEKIEIFYPNGIELRVPVRTDPEFIKSLIDLN